MLDMKTSAAQDLQDFLGKDKFACVLADPPWRFQNRTGKTAPEHKRLSRYPTLTLDEICSLPVADHIEDRAHCYLWVLNALLPEGLKVLSSWGFEYRNV
jgi:N6-adenosine-specific RNA methylase IME4